MSTELIEIQDSARQVLSEAGRAATEEKTWPLILELGWLLAAVPEELGGLGLGLAGTCAIQKELGGSLAAGPYLSAALAIDAVCNGQLADKESWVERFASSEYVAAPLADSPLTVTQGKLSGVATGIPSADNASHILVCTAECVALVPTKQSGIELASRPTWDVTRRLFDVRFKNVVIDEALIVARGANAKAAVTRLQAQRDFALAADSVGGATALLNMTVEYLQARKQFARPLAMFQALKHRCADLKTQAESADALLTDILNKITADTAVRELEVMGLKVKYLACSVYSRVAEEALQLHGGIGMTSDHACHLFLKRALLNEQLGRTGSSYELDIANALLSSY